MGIRPFKPEDECILRRLHTQSGFDWPFPDLSKSLSALVYTDDHDNPVMLLGTRPLAEAFAIIDPEWESPAVKMAALDALYRDTSSILFSIGIREYVAWLPPQIARTFSRRLKKRYHLLENKWQCLVGFISHR